MSRQFCDEFADLPDQFVTNKQRFMVCGDYNYPGSDGHQLDASPVDILQRYDTVHHVVDATRGDTMLDLTVAVILTRVTVHSTCFSDHHLVAGHLHVPCVAPSNSATSTAT